MLVLICVAAAGRADEPAPLVAAVRAHFDLAEGSIVPKHRYALVDLDGDGIPDAVILVTDRAYCGSDGCTLEIFRGTVDGFTFVSGSTLTLEPIRLSREASHGWRTLIVATRHRGNVLMRFDGRRYPLSPSMQPKASSIQIEGAAVLFGPVRVDLGVGASGDRPERP